MEIPLRITFKGLDPSPALEARIREKVAKLERFHDHIIGCHVTIEGPAKHNYHGRTYDVRIDLTVPTGELVVSRDPGIDASHGVPYVALRDAFAAAARRLEDHARRVRGDVKSHQPPTAGRVIRIDPALRFGFLETPDALQVYFHENAVAEGSFDELRLGHEVRFVLAEGEGLQGPQASTVTPVRKHHPPPRPQVTKFSPP